MSKREEAIEAMARALNPALWGAPHGDVLTNAMRGRALEHAATAFDAAIKVLMEPDEAMLMAGRKQTFADVTGSHLGPNAERTFQAMLKAASA